MQENIYRKVGTQLRSHRERLGWTQEELGEAAGLHPSFIGQIERGVKKASLRTVAVLAQAIGVGLGELIDGQPGSRDGEWESRISALLRHHRPHCKKILFSTLRHLSRELREVH